MPQKDRYRLIAIFAFIATVILLVILFIALWNNLSMNPEVHTSNTFYLLLILVFISTGALFVGHLLHVSGLHVDQRAEITGHDSDKSEEDELLPDAADSSPLVPYDIDIDQLAEFIIPRQNIKEDLETFSEKILSNVAKQFEIVLGIIYLKDEKTLDFIPVCTYAWASEKPPAPFKSGEGLNGQAAKNKKVMKLTDIPEGYIKIASGLGEGYPGNLLIVPLLLNKESIGIIELASFKEIDEEIEWTFRNLAKIISNSFVTKIKAIKENI